MTKENKMNTTEFAAELGTTPRNARKFLRSDARAQGKDIPGKGSRWTIEKKSLAGLKKRYAAWAEAQEIARQKRAEAAAAEVEVETTEG
jgi:predicted transcriptional regulator